MAAADILFRRFLEDEDEYHACEAFGQALVDQLAERHGQRGQWRRWRTLTNGDGTPMMDGNPIYDARSDTTGRAIRILQDDPADRSSAVGTWITDFAGDEAFDGFDVPSVELTVAVTLTPDSAVLAKRLLDTWMNPATSVERTHDELAALPRII